MLERRTYTRQELIELFKTERLDSIKGKLNRQGYKYTTSGRGKTFTLTITEQPLRFRNFCIEELHFAPQTDFKRLKKFLYRFMFDDDFRKLPYVTMREYMVGTMEITNQTLSRWVKRLYDENIVADGEMIYYAIDKKNGIYKRITKEEHGEAWKRYWEVRNDENGVPNGQYYIACEVMYEFIGGFPYKKADIIFNAFESKRIDTLKEILQEEIDLDE